MEVDKNKVLVITIHFKFNKLLLLTLIHFFF